MTAQSFTATEKRACVSSELAKRRHVYPRLIEAGKLTTQKAQREIALMEAIEADYQLLAGKERLL